MALSIPCEKVIRGCECTLDPTSNYSSEQPDSPVFYGQFTQPPTRGSFFAPACFGTCESVISQSDADLCAQRAAVECSLDGAPSDGNPLWSLSRSKFGNTTQECDAECGDGNGITVVEPPGTVVSFTQADADARAHGLACKRAKELLVCFITGSPLAQGNVDSFVSVPIVATGGNGDYEFVLDSGALPPGISLDEVGLLLGTPTVAATYTFALTVTDTGGGSATRTFSWVIADTCGVTTDFCSDPGACRVRVKDFNAADWVAGTFPPPFEANPCDVSAIAGWDGTMPFIADNQVAGCNAYNQIAGPTALSPVVLFRDLDINSVLRWQLDFTTNTGTYFHANGPTADSPVGTYTKDPDFSCTGPASLDIEAYTPSP